LIVGIGRSQNLAESHVSEGLVGLHIFPCRGR
jgi:hypothetical protein